MTLPVAIIGAGPAGIGAAIQLRRSGIEFLLLEKERVGGLLNEANWIENFPGVPKGVPGRALASRLKRQLAAAGIPVEKAQLLQLSFRDEGFLLRTEQGTLSAARVILACGTLPLPPETPLDPLQLRGRLFTGVLPLLWSRAKTIAIIGGGDAACDYALSLAANNQVHILVRSARPRALPLLVDRCRQHRRIVIHEDCRLAEVGIRRNGGIVLKTLSTLGDRHGEIKCQRILSAIGRVPALAFLDPELRAALPELASRKLIHRVGDVGNGRFRQAAIASGDGLRAAMEIHAGESPCG